MKLAPAWLVTIGACSILGCSTGEGEGWVRSDRLFMAGCWEGPFDLQPTFFAANPAREETLMIRIQRGDNIQELSDGLTVLVNDIKGIRGDGENPSLLDTDIDVGLPPEVEPVGSVDASGEPVKVSMALYLHDTCHAQIGTIHALRGWIRFKSLFSGDITEPVADNRLTDAEFEAEFADPRNFEKFDPAQATSVVKGAFSFFFQRGKPAQPFP